jgi:hypothetical protein
MASHTLGSLPVEDDPVPGLGRCAASSLDILILQAGLGLGVIRIVIGCLHGEARGQGIVKGLHSFMMVACSVRDLAVVLALKPWHLDQILLFRGIAIGEEIGLRLYDAHRHTQGAASTFIFIVAVACIQHTKAAAIQATPMGLHSSAASTRAHVKFAPGSPCAYRSLRPLAQ